MSNYDPTDIRSQERARAEADHAVSGLYGLVTRNVMVGSGFPAAWPTATNSLADQRLRV